MKLTVVGFWGAYPEEDSATSCYLLEKDDFKILLDCGSGALAQLPKYTDVMDINGLILSHYHQDHIADLGVLQYQWLVQNDIRQTDHVLPIFGHQEDKTTFDRLTHQATKGFAYQPEETLEIGPFSISFLKTIHPAPCYAMRITDGESTVVYTADSSFQDAVIPFAKDVDLLITDCSFYHDQDAAAFGHMNSVECGRIASQANVGHLLLSHHPHFGDRLNLKTEAASVFKGVIDLANGGFQWQSKW